MAIETDGDYEDKVTKEITKFKCDDPYFKANYPVKQLSNGNLNSPYIQIFIHDSYNRTLIPSGYTINQEVVAGILSQLTTQAKKYSLKKYFSFFSNNNIKLVNGKILENVINIKNDIAKLAERSVIPSNAVSNEGLINGNVAFSNFYIIKDAISSSLNSDANKILVNDILKVFDPMVPDRVKQFIEDINQMVNSTVESVLDTTMISVKSTLDNLSKAYQAWAGMPNSQKAQSIIKDYMLGLRSIKPLGKIKPKSLVESWLKSKGYKSGNLIDLDADITALITAAKKESEAK